MKKFASAILLCCLCNNLLAYKPEKKAHNAWSRIKLPTTDRSEPFGSYANGCMTGAKKLSPSGKGYVDMRRNRNRYYGHPNLIDFIHSLGEYTAQKHSRKHLIGDLSQPRGGRMNFGHSSHQVGLDVDIWMQTVGHNNSVNPRRDMKTIVNKVTGKLIKQQIQQPTRDALHFAASYPETARIFVNPIVKWHLCQTETDTSWLRKLRPWWGHDQHFHVRLRCPTGAKICRNQSPPPAGDGCNNGLFNWVDEQSGLITGRIKPKPRRKPKKPRPPKIPPAACEFIRQQ